jgi:PAS domain S-box-containing protein
MDTIRPSIASDTLRGLMDRLAPLKKGFDMLGDHAVITDTDAHILYANKSAERTTGFSLEEMLGKNPGDLWGGAMPQEFIHSVIN